MISYNKQKINANEKDFPESKTKLNNEIIKKHGGALSAKPRCLRYSLVTDLYSENINFFKLELASNLLDDSNCSFESETDLSAVTFSKVNFNLKQIILKI